MSDIVYTVDNVYTHPDLGNYDKWVIDKTHPVELLAEIANRRNMNDTTLEGQRKQKYDIADDDLAEDERWAIWPSVDIAYSVPTEVYPWYVACQPLAIKA
jgi:hypothetical protein